MVPIHDTDLAQERWSKAEWQNYELWEKVEVRVRRNRRLWILGAVVLFSLISAVPIVVDRWPKWVTRSTARTLAQEISQMKREAGVNGSAFRLRFPDNKSLEFVIEKLSDCSHSTGSVVRSGLLLSHSQSGAYSRISAAEGVALGIPGLVDSFCYDPLKGSFSSLQGDATIGFAFLPAKDLAQADHQRLDRVSVLLLVGSLAEESFD